MRSIDINDVREHWEALLHEVAEGSSVLITREGQPVAVIQPPDVSILDEAQLQNTIEELLQLRKGRTIGPGVTIRDLIEEGRRY